jgi:hypothetical protein
MTDIVKSQASTEGVPAYSSHPFGPAVDATTGNAPARMSSPVLMRMAQSPSETTLFDSHGEEWNAIIPTSAAQASAGITSSITSTLTEKSDEVSSSAGAFIYMLVALFKMATQERQMQMDNQTYLMDRMRNDLGNQLKKMDQEKWSQFAKGIIESGLELGSSAISLGGAAKGLKDMSGTVEQQKLNITNTKNAALAPEVTNEANSVNAKAETLQQEARTSGVSSEMRQQSESLAETAKRTTPRAHESAAAAVPTSLDCNNESILIRAQSDLNNAKFQQLMALGGLVKAIGPTAGSTAGVYATEQHMEVTSQEVERDLHGTHRQMAAEYVSNLDQFKSWVTSIIESFSKSLQDNVKASADRM